MSSVENEKMVLEKIKEQLTRKYGMQNTAVEESMGKLVKSFRSALFGTGMCISKVILKWCLKELFKLYYFVEDQRWNWKVRSKQNLRSASDIGVGERLVPLNQFLIVGAGN